MIIITYSEATADTIEQRLGEADYSYFFIYKKYLPALQKLGTLIAVREPHIEVDKIFHENPSEPCVFLSFTPPHRTLFDLQCPTVCVFAWEFSTIPEESWHDHPEYNWTMSLQRIGNAITISEYAAEVVGKAVSNGLNLSVIPAAVDSVEPKSLTKKHQNVSLHVKATLYDSRSYNLTTDMVSDVVRGSRDPLQIAPWDDRDIHLTFSQHDSNSTELLVGFYSSEDWGAWSRTKVPWVLLPHKVKGPTKIVLELVAFGNNIDRDIQVSFGDEQRTMRIAELPQLYALQFDAQMDTDVLKFSNLDLTEIPDARDNRSLGIGIKSMSISRPEGYNQRTQSRSSTALRYITNLIRGPRATAPDEAGNKLELTGVVYTSVLNPQDGRKNWEDMVTAFCWAFRNEPNATLVLKMTHNKLATFLGRLLLLYSPMSGFKCRVVAVHGFLTSDQYQTLMDSTHFVVNSSLCEGQCLPLMEFMGHGVPAIAPNHTAMADYVNEKNAFIVKSSLYPTYWPIDDRKSIRTMCYRIDWNSLKQAFEKSFVIVTSDKEAYQSLRINSVNTIKKVAGQEVVYEKMEKYLSSTARRATAL